MNDTNKPKNGINAGIASRRDFIRKSLAGVLAGGLAGGVSSVVVSGAQNDEASGFVGKLDIVPGNTPQTNCCNFTVRSEDLKRTDQLCAPKEIHVYDTHIEVLTHNNTSFKYDIPQDAPVEMLQLRYSASGDEKPPEKIVLHNKRFKAVTLDGKSWLELHPPGDAPPVVPIVLDGASHCKVTVTPESAAIRAEAYGSIYALLEVSEGSLNEVKKQIRQSALEQVIDYRASGDPYIRKPDDPNVLRINMGESLIKEGTVELVIPHAQPVLLQTPSRMTNIQDFFQARLDDYLRAKTPEDLDPEPTDEDPPKKPTRGGRNTIRAKSDRVCERGDSVKTPSGPYRS